MPCREGQPGRCKEEVPPQKREGGGGVFVGRDGLVNHRKRGAVRKNDALGFCSCLMPTLSSGQCSKTKIGAESPKAKSTEARCWSLAKSDQLFVGSVISLPEWTAQQLLVSCILMVRTHSHSGSWRKSPCFGVKMSESLLKCPHGSVFF